MFCGNISGEIDVYLPRANKESNKINSWESRGKGGGVHVFSVIREGGFEKLLCDLMGGCEKKFGLKKKSSAPPPPCSIHNECSLTKQINCFPRAKKLVPEAHFPLDKRSAGSENKIGKPIKSHALYTHIPLLLRYSWLQAY